MGQFSFASGISSRLYEAAHKWMGHMRGGLAIATVGACAGFAAICGSSTATAATMGMVALPEMRRFKYDPGLATGCIAAGGQQWGILIPPSVILIIYGIMTEQSIGKLFAAGFIPGIMEAVFYMITIIIICKINPDLGPRGPKTTLKAKVSGLWGGTAETMIIFVLVIGGLFGGWFTPTEAAGVGAALVLILSHCHQAHVLVGFQGIAAFNDQHDGHDSDHCIGRHYFQQIRRRHPTALCPGRFRSGSGYASHGRHGTDYRRLSHRRLFHGCPGAHPANRTHLVSSMYKTGFRSYLVRYHHHPGQ